MSERKNNVIQFKKNNISKIIGTIVVALFICFVVLMTCFKIDEIKVEGNKHYTQEQIKDFVLANGYVNNSILLMLKNRIHPIKDIPFIAKIDIQYDSAHEITISVYEKSMAGCIEYMNEYVYFDQDGYVLEISPAKLEDTPCITGMNFESMELHQKLPIEDEKRFKLILKMTQLLQKYNLKIPSIKFTSENQIVMQYEDIRIELGDGSNLEEQLIDLNQILDGIKGKKGTLDLKDFDAATGTASFKLETNTPKQKDEKEGLPAETEGVEDNSAQGTEQTE